MKTGRNDACPCGSGRKFKKCCEGNAPHVGREPETAWTEAQREHQQGRLDRAEELCREVLAAVPDHAGAFYLWGVMAAQQGRHEQAVELMRKAVALAPLHAAVHTNLALALHKAGRSEEGLPHVLKAIKLDPLSVDAVETCGRVLAELKRWAEAAPYCEQWAAMDPGSAYAHQMLGNCYSNRKLWQEAAPHYCKTLELNPDSVDAANNLGACLAAEGHHTDALLFCRSAVERKPDNADAWANLGLALKTLGQTESALQSYDMALSLQSAHANARWNRSLCLLALGRLGEGWLDYEARWDAGACVERLYPQPRWDGSAAAGKTILVWMEQGLGDHIFFAGMLPDLIHAGAHCVVECELRLVRLFARSFPGAEVVPLQNPPHPRTQLPDVDYQIAGGSLGRWFRPTLENFPRHNTYLVPDPARVGQWRERLNALGEGIKVGICWRSMVTKDGRWIYYSHLNQWRSILTTPGVHFVNLQYDQCDEELREAEGLFGTRIHVWGDTDLKDDQEGVAALIGTLDLVISAGTAVAEMAAALGIPTWVLLKNASDWNCLGQNYNPWHRSMRHFYCGGNNPWEPAIESVAGELRQLGQSFSR